MGQGAVTVQLPADTDPPTAPRRTPAEGPPGDVIVRDTPGREAAPTTATVASQPRAPARRPSASRARCRRRRARPTNATTSRLKPHDGRTSLANRHGVRPGSREALLQKAHLLRVARRLLVVLIGLGHDDHHGPVDVPAERLSVGRPASATDPARPASASRRNSARYLPSTAATAWSLVIARAATVAARSSRCTSSTVSERWLQKATSRPWSKWPAAMRTGGAPRPGTVGACADRFRLGQQPAPTGRNRVGMPRARVRAASPPRR